MKTTTRYHILRIAAFTACVFASSLLMASCGTKHSVTTDSIKSSTQQQASDGRDLRNLQFVQKVSDNALYQKDVVSKLNFTLISGSKNFTVPGSIHMRKDDVIRIQVFLPLLGTEVGRMEFTKDYVLIIDRIHKQYIKGDYNKVDFLSERGINFYSLQSLFWNQLFLPGQQKVDEAALSQFEVDLQSSGKNLPLTLRQGGMTFQWTADAQSALIQTAHASYLSGDRSTSELNWTYENFRTFGSKKFPHKQTLNFKTNVTKNKKDITIVLDMDGVSADSNWESRTSVSEKYKAVSVEDVLKQIMSL